MDKHQLSATSAPSSSRLPCSRRAGYSTSSARKGSDRWPRHGAGASWPHAFQNPDAKVGQSVRITCSMQRPVCPSPFWRPKQAKFSVGQGMQQALAYAEMLDAPLPSAATAMVLMHDRTGITQPVEGGFHSAGFRLWMFFGRSTNSGKGSLRPKRSNSLSNRFTPMAVAASRVITSAWPSTCCGSHSKGQQRVLLVMANGTGKTTPAFQIIWRMWKAKAKTHLFLADRNILVDQTMQQDFAPRLARACTIKVTNREMKKKTTRSIWRFIRP